MAISLRHGRSGTNTLGQGVLMYVGLFVLRRRAGSRRKRHQEVDRPGTPEVTCGCRGPVDRRTKCPRAHGCRCSRCARGRNTYMERIRIAAVFSLFVVSTHLFRRRLQHICSGPVFSSPTVRGIGCRGYSSADRCCWVNSCRTIRCSRAARHLLPR